jgi:hypothetical protein
VGAEAEARHAGALSAIVEPVGSSPRGRVVVRERSTDAHSSYSLLLSMQSRSDLTLATGYERRISSVHQSHEAICAAERR